MLCEAGRYRDCMQNLDESVSDASDPLLIIWESSILGQSLDAIPKAQRGEIVARLRTLEKRVARDDSDTATQIARHRVAGEILLAQGAAERATEEFRTASRLDSAIADREYWGGPYRRLPRRSAMSTLQRLSSTRRFSPIVNARFCIPQTFGIKHGNTLRECCAQETTAHLSVEKIRQKMDKVRFFNSKTSSLN